MEEQQAEKIIETSLTNGKPTQSTLRKITLLLSKYKQTGLYVLVYTALFLVIFRLGYAPFFESGKSFIRFMDGFTQHFPAMVYLGEYYRGIVSSLVSGHLEIPLFNFNTAFGENIIAMLSLFYGFGDPLVFLSTFFPVTQTETLYNFLAIFRLYLSGLTFSWFCFHFQKGRIATLIGSLTYAFCGYGLSVAIAHPSHIIPMVVLPVMLLGLDKIITQKKPVLFIFAVALTAISTSYFLYVTSIFLPFFVILRFFSLQIDHSFKNLVRLILRSVGAYLLGLGLAAVIFLPAILGLISSTRISNDTSLPNLLFFDFPYYRDQVIGLVSPLRGWLTLNLNMVGFGIISAIALMFSQKPDYRYLKIGLLICLAFLVIPFGGYLTNGFSYVNQRWTFVFSFLISFSTVLVFSSASSHSRRTIAGGIVFLILYGTMALTAPDKSEYYWVFGLVILTVSFLLLLVLQDRCLQRIFKKQDLADFQKVRSFVFPLFVTINLILNAYFLFSPEHRNLVRNYFNKGEALSMIQSASVNAAIPLVDEGFYRINSLDTSEIKRLPDKYDIYVQNQSLVLNYPGVQVYSSVLNPVVSDALKVLEDSQLVSNLNINGLDTRTFLESLAAVKYFTLEPEDSEYAPYGFELSKTVDVNGKPIQVFINRYALPLGYTYSSYITQAEYDQLPAIQKQEALLQSAVIEGETNLVKKGEPVFTSQPLKYTITAMNGLHYRDGVITVDRRNATMRIKFEGVRNSETYLRFKDFNISSNNIELATVYITTGSSEKYLSVLAPRYRYGLVNGDYLVNLGYNLTKVKFATLVFPTMGTYSLAGIEVFAQPMKRYPQQVKALSQEPLENIRVGINKVTGSVNLSKNKILCFSLAFSPGWSARVDGIKTDLMRVNDMFLGLPLTAGQHEIELTYRTPGLLAGLIITLLTSLTLAGYAIYKKFSVNHTDSTD